MSTLITDTAAAFFTLVAKGNHAVICISAAQAGRDADANERAHGNLADRIQAMHATQHMGVVDWAPATGVYDGCQERSFMILVRADTVLNDWINLGHDLGQESILVASANFDMARGVQDVTAQLHYMERGTPDHLGALDPHIGMGGDHTVVDGDSHGFTFR